MGRGTKVLGRIAGVAAVAVSVGAFTSGVAAAAPGCTDTYTGAGGGGWYTPAAWSAGHVPTAADSVCIPGSASVGVSNDSITVANLTIASAGSFSIGDGGPSLGRFTITGKLINEGTIEDSWGGTFQAKTFVNSGTFDVPPQQNPAELLSFATVQNTGTFVAGTGTQLTLTNGGVFANAGTINASEGQLAISSPRPGAGTLELDPGGALDTADQHPIIVADAVAVDGGSVCGAPLLIGSGDGGGGGSLTFSAAAATAADCGAIPGPSDSFLIANVPASLSGTIPSGSSVTVGDAGISHATVSLVGHVINDGSLQVGYGAQVFGDGTADTLVNAGTIDVPSSGDPVTLDTGLTNLGSLDAAGGVTATLGKGQAWSNGTDGTDATITGGVSLVSSPGQSAPFTQDGTIEGSLEVAEPVEIAGGAICGTLEVGSFEDNRGGTLAWAPQRDPGIACPTGEPEDDVTVDGVPVTLNSDIPANYTLTLTGLDAPPEDQADAQLSTPGPLVNNGTLVGASGSQITINGTFTNRGTFTTDDEGSPVLLTATRTLNLGQLMLNGVSLDVSGSLENGGKATIGGPTQLAVSDDYTQDATGTLDLVTPNAARVVVGGSAKLAGTVHVASGPPSGTQVTVLTDNGTQGTFSTVKGPYTLSYAPTGVTATTR